MLACRAPQTARNDFLYTLLGADGAYAGELVAWVLAFAGWVLEIVKRPEGAKGFVLLPRRWVVERAFAWLMKCRRLCRDYEETCQSSEAGIRLAMLQVMAKRLARPSGKGHAA